MIQSRNIMLDHIVCEVRGTILFGIEQNFTPFITFSRVKTDLVYPDVCKMRSANSEVKSGAVVWVIRELTILKGKRNAYFEFLNVGFLLRTLFFLISAIYIHLFQQLNSSAKFCNFRWWRVPISLTSLPRTGVHWLYVKETKARKRMTYEDNESLSKFPP